MKSESEIPDKERVHAPIYFAREDVSAEFNKIVDATKELDVQLTLMDRGERDPEAVHEVSMNVRRSLQIWNDLALRALFSTQK